jgi:hypothetical protein
MIAFGILRRKSGMHLVQARRILPKCLNFYCLALVRRLNRAAQGELPGAYNSNSEAENVPKSVAFPQHCGLKL